MLSVVSSDTGEVTTRFCNSHVHKRQLGTPTGRDIDRSQRRRRRRECELNDHIAVVDGSSSNEFDNVADQTFTVANTDDDDAAFTVTPSATM